MLNRTTFLSRYTVPRFPRVGRPMSTSPYPIKNTHNTTIHTNRGFVVLASKMYPYPTVDYPIMELLNKGKQETHVVFGYSGQGPERSKQMDEECKVSSGFIYFAWQRGVGFPRVFDTEGCLSFVLSIRITDITENYNKTHSTKLSNEEMLSNPERLNKFFQQNVFGAPLDYHAGTNDIPLYRPICEEMTKKVVLLQSIPKKNYTESEFDRYFDEVARAICLHRPNFWKDTVIHSSFPSAMSD